MPELYFKFHFTYVSLHLRFALKMPRRQHLQEALDYGREYERKYEIGYTEWLVDVLYGLWNDVHNKCRAFHGEWLHSATRRLFSLYNNKPS